MKKKNRTVWETGTIYMYTIFRLGRIHVYSSKNKKMNETVLTSTNNLILGEIRGSLNYI